MVRPKLDNPHKRLRLLCFPYLGQVGFAILLYSKTPSFLIGPGRTEPCLQPQRRAGLMDAVWGWRQREQKQTVPGHRGHGNKTDEVPDLMEPKFLGEDG